MFYCQPRPKVTRRLTGGVATFPSIGHPWSRCESTLESPVLPPTSQQKDKKAKALFNAPPVPPSVLHPHAHAHAPTPLTGIAGLNVPVSTIEGMSTLALDNRAGVRVLTTKRTRELQLPRALHEEERTMLSAKVEAQVASVLPHPLDD